ncbi:hypothetical protein [Streptomyces boncukensis]|uniref:Uncharacterized protein n=1 Tax=Streptomyces boncukensis TaxID=2711219 RepID=A0A6G4WU35_9ACTN|nr:hypothetical protein [Streptomyces boncukensis]NGO68513.1 hypothetical protein [Streptomyces boncukensis]
MGYKRQRRIIHLQFDQDHELAGLEVRLRSLSLRNYKELLGIGEVDRSDVGSQLEEFARSLISWNLEDEETGEPIPATPEAVDAEDADLMQKIAGFWFDALTGVIQGDPLPDSSPGGGQSPEATIPMEPLSESRAS